MLKSQNNPFNTIKLTNNTGIQLLLSDYAASWLSCRIPLQNGMREILLSCQDLTAHQGSYMGMTIGRYANRINNAQIKIGHQLYQLKANQGKHQLHGANAYNEKQWQILLQTTNRVIFALVSEDGECGFPGRVYTTVDYLLIENRLEINYIAASTKTTPINLTNHAYFNLDGGGDARNQTLFVNADYFVPVDQEGIPTAGLKHVAESNMDLTTAKRLIDDFLTSPERKLVNGYDHAYLLNRNQVAKLNELAAVLTSADKKVSMNVYTNKPALQVYSGNFLQGVKNSLGENYANYAGIALETQFLPDSPNRNWSHESCWFSENQIYNYTMIYQFNI